ncbi:hypothetical protein KJ865_07910, partial [Myxococcota bacterium]|nr:hypothetical protein [Myxococcota bacterium]
VFVDRNAYRIVKRVSPPPKVADIDSKEILGRKAVGEKVAYKVIHIGWRLLKTIYAGALTKKAMMRSQAQAADVATSLLKQLMEGGNFDKLYKEYSEAIPKGVSSHQHHFGPLARATEAAHKHGMNAKGHEEHKSDKHLSPAERIAKNEEATLKATQLVKIHKLALRLKVGESGIVTSKFGYHVVKRYK